MRHFGNLRFGTQGHDHVTYVSQWSHCRSTAGSRHSTRNPESTSATPLSPMSPPKQSRATCRGVVDQAFADPVVHKRMTGKYMLDVFGGSGFVAKATAHLGLRGNVLDTKFWRRYNVTKPLFSPEFDRMFSPEKCVAGMISPPRQHTACSPKVISASAAIAN